MSIKNFYPRRYFDENQSKSLLIVLAIFWALFIPYAAFMFESLGLLAIWLIFGIHQFVGIMYCLKKGLYRKKNEKPHKTKNVHPEEFLARVKKEVGHGKG